MASKYPCNECYGNEGWEVLRAKWMENYQLGHPLENGVGVERLVVLRGLWRWRRIGFKWKR